ncbi:MAG: PIN domain-containing protein [Thermoplasmata archaeon]
MTVIVDTNVVIAALIKDGVVRRILVGNPGAWVMPDTCFEEIWRHRGRWNRHNVGDNELKTILDEFVEDYVFLLSSEVYNEKMSAAEKLSIDQDDAPVIALALSVENEGIWTFNTKHFKNVQSAGINLLTTEEIAKTYKPMK